MIKYAIVAMFFYLSASNVAIAAITTVNFVGTTVITRSIKPDMVGKTGTIKSFVQLENSIADDFTGNIRLDGDVYNVIGPVSFRNGRIAGDNRGSLIFRNGILQSVSFLYDDDCGIGFCLGQRLGADTFSYFYNPRHVYSGEWSLVSSSTVSSVPEVATWALLTSGFGLTGAAMRRRLTVAA